MKLTVKDLDMKLDRIIGMLHILTSKGTQMAGELQALTTQVKANTDTEASAILVLQGIKAALDAAIASGNPAALADLSNQLGTSQAALAAAIVANTPAVAGMKKKP